MTDEATAREIRHNPLLWLLAFVPVVFVAASTQARSAHVLLFVLSVLAIVPLAALLSHATESVAAKTGDAVGGLLNATLGNLTELVIALAALRAGQVHAGEGVYCRRDRHQYVVHARRFVSLGGLKHHVQEFNRVSARIQAGLLFLATIALLIPSAVTERRLWRRGRHSRTSSAWSGRSAHRCLRSRHAVLAKDSSRVLRQCGAH